MIEFIEAMKLLESSDIRVPRAVQTLHIFSASGSVLSKDIKATRPLPPFSNSAMDGYAIKLADYGKILSCKGIILAGDNASEVALQNGECYKVMTGAMLPQGTEAVVQIEWVSELDSSQDSKQVQIPSKTCTQSIAKYQNIRLAAEEIAPNALLLKQGKRLNHLDVSILASQGISEVECYKPLNIAIYSSGDEVIEPGSAIEPHQIYNTNATSLFTLLTSKGYKCEYRGILADSVSALESSVKDFKHYDVVITSGGASVGDADLIKGVLANAGARFIFDGINVKPGRHLALAKLDSTLIVLLPGNPLALLLHTHTILLSLLESMQGAYAIYPKHVSLKLGTDIRLKSRTTNILLGQISNDTFMPYNGGKIGASSLVNMWKNEAIALFECSKRADFKANEPIKLIWYNVDFCDTMEFLNT